MRSLLGLLRLLPILIVAVVIFVLLSIFSSKPVAQEPLEEVKFVEKEPITIHATIKASKPQPKPKPVVAPAVIYTGSLSTAAINYLGSCESGNDPKKNTGNGYFGEFQFSINTWNGLNTGYPRADLAPRNVQITAVQKLLSRSSIYTQFPFCAKKMRALGLV